MNAFQFKPALFSFFLALATILSGCGHDHDDDDPAPHHSNSATITITTPAEGSQVKAGRAVTISGKIEAVETLHGYDLIIRRKADNVKIFEKEIHDHAATITINEPWTVDAFTQQTDLELEVVATLDHEGNTASKKVNFQAIP